MTFRYHDGNTNQYPTATLDVKRSGGLAQIKALLYNIHVMFVKKG